MISNISLNENLIDSGRKKVSWARMQMPVLAFLREKYSQSKPLSGLKIGGSLHMTKETAVLIETLISLGAKLAWCASNPLSTKDDVVHYLKSHGIPIFAWQGMQSKDYYASMDAVLEINPDFIVDDGGDFLSYIYLHKKEYLGSIRGATEQTSTGVTRLRALEASEFQLRHPVIAVNDSITKREFDNIYGTGQSVLEGILRVHSTLISGKKIVVVGYGYCGQGVALRARGMGAHVIVTEVSKLAALKAVMDGFDVMSLDQASALGDIFITVTGMKNVIRREHFLKMKDQAVLANAGHYNSEIALDQLEACSDSRRKERKFVESYQIQNKTLYLLAEGRLVNLVCAEGHPPDIMDLSFANQVLALLKLASEENLEPTIYVLPEEIDEKVSQIKLESMNIFIDELTSEQKAYKEDFKM